ncbi:MAG TPA: hypothetical protein VHH88_10215 [Verrucomicrobiae bacterium]|nr:hypothetical protein [Verrucomicrobiae bacterium]
MTPALQSDPASSATRPNTPDAVSRWLRLGFVVCLWLLALYQFSETTADPDLWGHVAFGQQMLQTHSIQRAEIYSWTARGQPFVNHEYGADLILATAYRLLGGSGILLLKVLIGLLTFAIALRLGLRKLSWPESGLGMLVAAVAVVEISFGFAARPQIFTALFLALTLLLLRRAHRGSWWCAALIPPLFLVWINIHGGALAGMGLLFLTAGVSSAEYAWSRFRRTSPRTPPPVLIALWAAALGAVAASFCNPWGGEMLRWLIKSVLWFRPEIQEWNPTPFGWDHLNFFILLALAAFAWAASRRERRLWELAACCAFAFLGWRSVRNTPLFAIVALSLIPEHLVDALARFKSQFAGLCRLGQNSSLKTAAASLLWLCSLGSFVAIFTLHKDHPLTMEAPRSVYPSAAVQFMKTHQLQGKLLVFFDWGDFVIFHLPGCQPSIDGRLDACYSRQPIAQHWKLYNGESVDDSVLPVHQADLALMPSRLQGAVTLRDQAGWQVVYFDDTAVILARNARNYPALKALKLPVEGPKAAGLGRAPFPG